MRLSDIPWKDLKVGDVLISARGKSGSIVALDDLQHIPGRDDPDYRLVSIKWIGVEQKSCHASYLLDQVIYLGQ